MTTTSTLVKPLATTTTYVPFTRDLATSKLPNKRAITTSCKPYKPALTFSVTASKACSCLSIKPSATIKTVTTTSTIPTATATIYAPIRLNPECFAREAAIFALEVTGGDLQDIGKVVTSTTQTGSGSPYVEVLSLSRTPRDVSVLYVNGTVAFPELPQSFASVESNTLFAADPVAAGATSYKSTIGTPRDESSNALECGQSGGIDSQLAQCNSETYDGFGVSTVDGTTLQLYKGDPAKLGLRRVELSYLGLCERQK